METKLCAFNIWALSNTRHILNVTFTNILFTNNCSLNSVRKSTGNWKGTGPSLKSPTGQQKRNRTILNCNCLRTLNRTLRLRLNSIRKYFTSVPSTSYKWYRLWKKTIRMLLKLLYPMIHPQRVEGTAKWKEQSTDVNYEINPRAQAAGGRPTHQYPNTSYRGN